MRGIALLKRTFSIKRGMTAICEHRFVIAHFNQTQLDEFPQVVFTDWR